MTAAVPGEATSSTVVAIHQPNFFPWLGWFHKLAQADVFVLLDDVEFSRGSYINRTRLLVNGQPVWKTAPVVRTGTGTQSIQHTRINDATPWRAKMLKTLENAYGRRPGFDEVYPVLRELVGNPVDTLADYNEQALAGIAGGLGLPASRFVRSSTFECTARATERLVELVTAVGGTTYLSGGGAAGYQEEKYFDDAGIELAHTGFVARPYPQRSEPFVPGLSVIDALMNVGFSETRSLLETGDRPA